MHLPVGEFLDTVAFVASEADRHFPHRMSGGHPVGVGGVCRRAEKGPEHDGQEIDRV